MFEILLIGTLGATAALGFARSSMYRSGEQLRREAINNLINAQYDHIYQNARARLLIDSVAYEAPKKRKSNRKKL